MNIRNSPWFDMRKSSVMRNALSVICLFIAVAVNGQIKTKLLASSALPKNISFLGKPVQAVQYDDKTGNYMALITQTGTQPQKGDEDNRQAHLYAYVYELKTPATPALLWQMHDMVTDCNLDIVADFVRSSFTVTDLDHNGKAEVWVMYRLSCKGDVSPNEMKIIMHEGNLKYAMRGIGKIRVGNVTQPDGGIITSDDFRKAPFVFREYAGKLWDKNVLEVLK